MFAMATVHATHMELQMRDRWIRATRHRTGRLRPGLSPGGWMFNCFPGHSRRRSRAFFATGTLPAGSYGRGGEGVASLPSGQFRSAGNE